MDTEDKSDFRVVMQFFIVPLALVAVLVAVFFGLQFARSRRADPAATLASLESYRGFLSGVVGDLKRWQYGYDLSLLIRGQDAAKLKGMLPDLIRVFREAGERHDLKLRRYMALALGSSADAGAAAALREGLRDADPETRLFSVWGLMRSGDPSAVADLRGAVADPDPGVRKMAVFALGEARDGESAPVLRQALADSVNDVRWNAALSLARLKDGSATPVLMTLLQDSAAMQAGTGPPAGEPAGGRRERALNAIRGLALLQAPEAHDLLARLSSSAADPAIREAAGLAIASYGQAGGASSP